MVNGALLEAVCVAQGLVVTMRTPSSICCRSGCRACDGDGPDRLPCERPGLITHRSPNRQAESVQGPFWRLAQAAESCYRFPGERTG